LIKKEAPVEIFLEARAIEIHLPEASGTFGSSEELY
jgi:hypothetical protein